MAERQLYKLKVTLQDSRPPIWRRFEVPADVTLFKLHQILQLVMGWTDSHLHQFRRGETLYGESDPEFGIRRRNEKRVRLAEVLLKPKDRMVYEYDFGDGWQHDIVLEDTPSPEPRVRYPRVLAGKRACPPEDIGGMWGFYGFLEAIRDPKHPEHEEMLEWWGSDFNPEEFDVEEVNLVLHPGSRRRPDA
ncbi:MAG: plasmid pRiA4b ORF-3 family protein [Candidatus Polarisedimenticolia bacterium]